MRVYRYVQAELVRAFVYAVAGMLVVALPVIAVAAVARLQGVGTLGVLRFLPLLLAGLVPYVLPLAYLLAVVTTYGRLAADNEWTSIRMAGFHPARVLLPGLALACAIAWGMEQMMAVGLPAIRRAQDGYKVRALREQFQRFAPGATELRLGPLYLSSAWRDGDDFVDALVDLPPRGEQPASTVLAGRVRFRVSGSDVYVACRDARILAGATDDRSENPSFRFDLDQLVATRDASFGAPRHKTSAELATLAADPATTPEKRAAYVFEIHNRRAISATCFMFLLLGAPTGLLLRRGTQLGALAAAVGYALLYYLLSMRLSKELATSRLLPPAAGAWTVLAAGTCAGLVLTFRALRE